MKTQTDRTTFGNRALAVIANHGKRNDGYLLQLVREYRAMSLDVHIVVLSNIPKDVGPGVEVVVIDLRGKNPWSLPFSHKQIFAERLNDFDLFIYSEDDTLIRERNIRAFLDVSAVLPEDEIAGFLRYEESSGGELNYPEVHGHFHWDPGSVRLRDPYTVAFFTNEHAGCYVLTREQLRRAIASGGYLVEAHRWKYDLLCSAATDPYTQCGAQKVICISHLDDFLVHHLPNTYVGTSFGVDDCELRRQITVLQRIGLNGSRQASLFETETKLSRFDYSKNYYEPVRAEVVCAIPEEIHSVLSIGCGWGAMEGYLAEKGLRVSAVPLDPVIAAGAEAKGIEIVKGGLAEALRQLAHRRFDCLLLSNVLHLVPNPVETLSSFATLLASGGTAIAVAPNSARLAATWRAFRHGGSLEDFGSYERTGVHRVSRDVLCSWFRAAGMSVEKVTKVLGPPAQKVGRLTFEMLDRWMAYEFVAVAKKHP